MEFDDGIGVSVSIGADLNVRLVLGESETPREFVQGAPLPSPTPDDYKQQIIDEFLTWELDGRSTDPVLHGETLASNPPPPNLWSDAFPTCSILEPTLPDSNGRVGFREVDVDIDELDSIHQHALKNQSMDIMRDAVGEDQKGDVNDACTEAESGLWTQELISGDLPKVKVPGLNHGMFGKWAEKEEEEAFEDKVDDRGGGGNLSRSRSVGGSNQEHHGNGKEIKYDDILSGLWLNEEEATEVPATPDAKEKVDVKESSGRSEPNGASLLNKAETSFTDNSARRNDNDEVDMDMEAILTGQGSRVDQTVQASTSKQRGGGNEWADQRGLSDLNGEFAKIEKTMAKRFPFELDTFQKEAICNLEMGRSVFVAAHTSAGKTVVAEYAFALATKHGTRAVYTSPIKTISNQKFRDFGKDFEVGLMTGDVQIRPDASCLIMTTEILRSMLYKGADLIRDMEFVIFDEVHYVNDAERGVVWEETIIMLPPHCNIVLLSATVPNVGEFAGWVGRTKKQKVYVSGTDRRPVPLEHCLFYNKNFYTISEGSRFMESGLRAAQREYKWKNKKALTPKEIEALEAEGKRFNPNTHAGNNAVSQRGRGRGGRRGGGQPQQHGGRFGAPKGKSQQMQLKDLIQMLQKKSLLPAIVFFFSKFRLDECADRLWGSLNLTTAKEKHEIHAFCEKSLSRLGEDDRELPQIVRIKALLKNGLAVHHAGLLPIMKEVVEMLFCRGLVKVLFATETFAMGVNAPARTVVFESLQKPDGRQKRTLLSGEYIQMAGRAGRRGKDKVGTVVIACWEELPAMDTLNKLLVGGGVTLTSQFRLTYSMILNLMRVEDLKVEDMLKRSFAEFHAQRAQPEQLLQLEKGEKAIESLKSRHWPDCYNKCSKSVVEKYYNLTHEIQDINSNLTPLLMNSPKFLKSLVPGRVVLVSDSESGLINIGLICGTPNSGGKTKGRSQPRSALRTSTSSEKKYHVLSLHKRCCLGKEDKGKKAKSDDSGLHFGRPLIKKDSFSLMGKGGPKGWGDLPHYGNINGTDFRFAEVELTSLVDILDKNVKEKSKLNLDDLIEDKDSPAVQSAVKKLKELEDSGELAPMDMKVGHSIEAYEWMAARQTLLDQLLSMSPHKCTCLPIKYPRVHNEKTLKKRLEAIEHSMSDATLQQMPEFENRVEVLEKLEYVDSSGTVKLKGRVACEINSGDELVVTEMIFAGMLSDLEPEEAVALVSAFVFQDKSKNTPQLTPTLQTACDELYALCSSCGELQFSLGLPITPDQYCENVLNFKLVEVVHEWAKGTPFKDICMLTDIMEGAIVRTIVRLEQACREIMDAARVMGNTGLFVQMQQAATLIKRDVIFAASLYVT